MVLSQMAVMTVIGGAAGLALAALAGRYAQSLLFELKGYDPVVFASSAVPARLHRARGGLRARAPRVARGPDDRAASTSSRRHPVAQPLSDARLPVCLQPSEP